MPDKEPEDQIPLFDIHAANNKPPQSEQKKRETKLAKKQASETKKAAQRSMPLAPEKTTRGAKKRGSVTPKTKMSLSGQVPEGDVRLTANIRDDLHLKLKIAAARRRTTIGELLEELVEQYL